MSCTLTGPLMLRTFNPVYRVQVRTHYKVHNTYKEPGYDRKLLLATCEPIKATDRRPAWEKCKLPEFKESQVANKLQTHPYEIILAREMKEEMMNAKLIAFYHKNSTTRENFQNVKNLLQHQNLWLKTANRKVYQMAITGTKFESLSPVLTQHQNTVVVIAKGDADLKRVLQMDKKMAGFVLMFAFLEDRLLRKDELMTYSQLTSIQDVRAQLAGTLNHALASLSSHMSQPATLLSLVLNQYVKDEEKKSKS